MNLGFEEEELKPYSEPEPDLSDQARIRESLSGGHLCTFINEVCVHINHQQQHRFSTCVIDLILVLCALYMYTVHVGTVCIYLHVYMYVSLYLHVWVHMCISKEHTNYQLLAPTERMKQMGFTSKEIKESLQENRYDEVCATYMLLQRDLGDSNVSPTLSLSLDMQLICTVHLKE